ncbi:MAG: hypothetical protein HY020_23325 [Burkholderiales bacterium]|nr:hypothetical protein [Burkholderiales bacterium]
MKYWITPAVLFVLCATQAGAQPAEGKIVLKRDDGEMVVVPVAGPGRDARAEQLAREIQSLDKQIAESVAGAQTRSAQPDPVQVEVLRMAREARNEALADLTLALAVAGKTSAGALDDETVARAKESAQSAAMILNTQPPSSLLVATDISTSLPDARLHYMSNQKHRLRSTEWSSYTARERLQIGRYVFRVQSADRNTEVYEELVLVLSDPTQKRLTPVGASGQ